MWYNLKYHLPYTGNKKINAIMFIFSLAVNIISSAGGGIWTHEPLRDGIPHKDLKSRVSKIGIFIWPGSTTPAR